MKDGTTRRSVKLSNGASRTVVVKVHPDPLCMTLLRQIREYEAIQIISRARLIWRDPSRPCVVKILGSTPLPIEVDELVEWGDVMPNRFVRVFERTAAMPLAYGELARCFPEVWPSREAVKKDWSRERGGQNPIRLYPGFPRWIGILSAPCTDFRCEISFLQ